MNATTLSFSQIQNGTAPVEPPTRNLQRTYIYLIKEKLSNWERIAKCIAGVCAFIFTLGFGLGLGLLSAALREKIADWYEECQAGIRKVKHLQTAPIVPDTIRDQINDQTQKPDPALDLNSFINKARKKITALSLLELENGLKDAIKTENLSPADKMTLLTVCEKVAQTYIKNQQFEKAFQIRIKTAQAIIPASPLAKLHHNLGKAHPLLGLRIQSVGTSLFKNHTLAIQKRNYGNQNTQLHVTAKLSHPARAQITATLNRIQSNPKELLEILPAGFCSDINVYSEDCLYHGRAHVGSNHWTGPFSSTANGFTLSGVANSSQPIQVIEFKGVGKIKIGKEEKIRAEYNKITIELDPSIPDAYAAAKLNMLFATLGLGTISSTSRPEDTERVKVMQLFRAYYPKEAYHFERDAKSFEESVESLKARIEFKVPDMKKKFKHYLIDYPYLMYKQEVYPGQTIWAIQGLAQEARKAGALGLMAGVGNGSETIQEVNKRIISILKIGALSTQDRFQAGITAYGASSPEDLRSGGGESVFTRMITKGMQNETAFSLQGQMQILYDLSLVERVGYAYSTDKYGTKEPTDYQNRSNIIELVKKIERHPTCYKGNEVCIRHRIPPQYIRGIKVNNENDKLELIAALKSEGLLTKNAGGKDCVNGILVDKFIVVGPFFKAHYWN